MKYLTKDNITLALSILASVGTVATWLTSIIKTRKRISLRIVKLCKIDNMLIMYNSVLNKSSAPIIINGISIKIDDNIFPCYEIPQKVFEITNKTGNTINSRKEYYTIQFPINLQPLSGISGYFAFDIPEEALKELSSPLTVQVRSNRGKAVEIKLNYENESKWTDMY